VEVSELPRFCTPLHAFNAHACMTGLHRIMLVQSLTSVLTHEMGFVLKIKCKRGFALPAYQN